MRKKFIILKKEIIKLILKDLKEIISLKKKKILKLYIIINDSMFQISCNLEPNLISGETYYKTHLAKEFLNNENISVVSLNKESDINQLLGNSIFLNNLIQK